MLFRKPRSYGEVLNDLDDEIALIYEILRDPARAARLRDLLALTPYSRTEFFRSYERAEDPMERARRRIVRAGMAFGTTSGKRNRTGFRATPWRGARGTGGSFATGVGDWANYPTAIDAFTARLQGVLIECRPAVEIVLQQDGPETLFYCDPPYPLSTRTGCRWKSDNERAYAHEMTDDDHRALAGVLREVVGMVVLSGYPCPLYDEDLYPDWMRVERKTLADGAKERTEVLWLNASAEAALSRRSPSLFSHRGPK